MDAEAIRIRKHLRDDYEHYARTCLKIRTKSGNIEPFLFNKAQKIAHAKIEQQKRETGKVRAIILKGRQQGFSTYIGGRQYWLVTHTVGLRSFILTHHVEATNNLFEMAQRFHYNCPQVVRPPIKASNAKELVFEQIESGYKLGTAGNKGVGRSSTIQLLHGSEVAFWPHASEHAKGIMQAVPNSRGTEIFLESTANGVNNYFHQQWQLAEAGHSDFIPIFSPWFLQDEYVRSWNNDFKLSDDELNLAEYYQLSKEQISWRRQKIIELAVNGIDGTKAFQQEYPCNSVEAFQNSGLYTFITPEIIMAARKGMAQPSGALIIGVDPARFGDDLTSIIFRRGRVAYNLNSYAKKDTMQVVGLVHKIILDYCPSRVCIDIGGLGAGVYDRLVELGYGNIVCAVNSGSTPFDQDRYINKRAEMWGEMKNWLLESPCQIPDLDSLHSDLGGIQYSFDSYTRLKMERKEDMKKRGIRSPNEADALALTFAYPQNIINQSEDHSYDELAKNLMSGFKNVDRLKQKAYT